MTETTKLVEQETTTVELETTTVKTEPWAPWRNRRPWGVRGLGQSRARVYTRFGSALHGCDRADKNFIVGLCCHYKGSETASMAMTSSTES